MVSARTAVKPGGVTGGFAGVVGSGGVGLVAIGVGAGFVGLGGGVVELTKTAE